MGFPFLAPLSPWIVEVLKEREESTFDTAFRNPYAILTSGALVVKGTAESDQEKRKTQLVGLITNPPDYPKSYKGCIISNNSNDIGLSYQTGKTIVGIDFEGHPIEVEGETGRKVSTPIITSIEIDTDGANNTLKTARVNLICFTLKQLEMFELFFMKPGMNVLLEWGDSSLLKTKFNYEKLANTPQVQKRKYNRYKDGKEIEEFKQYTKPEEALVPKTGNYNTWCTDFSDYYRSDTNAIANYLERIEKSLGTYDLVAGKVLDYSFSMGDNGTYQIMVEISQGNQVSLAIPNNPTKGSSKLGTQILDPNITPYDQIMELIASDFNLEKSNLKKILDFPHPIKGGKWENDWFNFLKVNKEQKDTVASQDAYVSLRFVLKILMNYILVNGNVDEKFFTFNLPVYNKKAGNTGLEMNGKIPKEYNVLPVTSNTFIMSSSDEVVFPSKELPTIVAPIQPKENQPALSDEENIIKIGKDKIDGTINGYTFHITDTYVVPHVQPFIEIKPSNENDRIGDALNIFLKYETVVKLWKKNQTRIDFLEAILNMVNSHSYGLFQLVYGLQVENSLPTIVDYKAAAKEIQLQNQKVEIYRFKPTTIKSIVKSFSFNFQMSNLVAGRTLFNSNKAIAEAKSKLTPEELKNIKTDSIQLPPNAYKSIDNSTFANSDGWYSINNVELKRIEANFATAKKNINSSVSKEGDSKTATKEAQNLTDVVNTKTTKFILDKAGKNIKPLIYKDTTFIQDYILQSVKSENKKSTLSPIDITITIDGFSGFRCGQYFNVDGIPEIYNQIGVFQITNTKHNIQTDGGWTTTIEAGFRIVDKKK